MSIGTPYKDYRFQFPVWHRFSRVFAIVAAVVFFSASMIWQVRNDRFLDWTNFAECAAIALAMYAVLALFGLALVRFFPLRVGPNGIRCVNYWMIPRTVTWDRLRSVVLYHDLGVEYLICDVKGMWFGPLIPTWIQDRQDLHSDLCRFAGPSHPLAKAFLVPTK